MERKQIQINPAFFKLKNRRKNSTKKRPKIKHSLRTKDIKQNLLKRIKQHQQRSSRIKNEDVISIASPIDIEFEKSVEYLNSIKKEKKRRQEKKQHVDKNYVEIPKTIMNKTQKKSLIRPDPPYGVLKTGKKPLYRDYMKKKKEQSQSIVIHDNKIQTAVTKNISERQLKLETLKKKYKIRKRRFTLGKNLKNGKIGVLIKNRTMKKSVQKELWNLKNEPLYDIKKYLRKHGLLRIGTPAPEHIVRNIYQDSKSAGDIYNKSSDILLHNYLGEPI